MIGSDKGIISSFIATRSVPCTGGARRKVSLTTASRSGNDSSRVSGSCWCDRGDETSGDAAAMSSSRSSDWIDGLRAR